MGIFKKYEGNPILKANKDNYWESLCVLNPAVIYDEESKEFKMIYRAAGDDIEHHIYLGLATSKDGYHFTRCFDKPVISPDFNGADGGCCEDPRLIKLGKYYYLTYASRTFAPGQYWLDNHPSFGFKPEFGPTFLINNNSITYLAISDDLVNWKKLGRISDSRYDDRDVYIAYDSRNSRFIRISRPMEWCGEGYPCKRPSIWVSYSKDLMEWDKPNFVYEGRFWWDDLKCGGSTPLIETEYGWLMTYHGVCAKDKKYRIGAIMLDKDDLTKIIAITKNPILEPEYSYELEGFYNGCVFPNGIVVKDDILYFYYGTADKYICVCTTSYSEFIDKLMKGEL